MAQQQKIESEAETGAEGQQVATHVLWSQLANEEQRHADDADRDRDQIA